MSPVPHPPTAFPELDAALMRDVYGLASSALAATHHIDDTAKYKLAGIVIYIVMCARRSDGRDGADREAMAEEAIGMLLELPRPVLTPDIRR